jgi:hypothetical protein
VLACLGLVCAAAHAIGLQTLVVLEEPYMRSSHSIFFESLEGDGHAVARRAARSACRMCDAATQRAATR